MKHSFLLTVFSFLVVISGPLAAQEQQPATKPFAYTPHPLDIVTGTSKAPVTIVEYASLSCPHCAHFHKDVLPELRTRYIDTGKLKLVFRHYPLNEPALHGSKLIACVPKEEKEKYLKVLFSMQDKWAFDADFNGALRTITSVGGMDPGAFDACQKDTKLEKQILQARLDAGNNGWVSSTPTFYINGKKFEGEHTVDAFVKEIDALLAKK